MSTVAKAVACGVAQAGCKDVQVCDILRLRLWAGGQSGKNYWQRVHLRHDTMVSLACTYGRDIVIVDDVVTTGATIMEAARCVTQAGNSGNNIIGACCMSIAAPPKKWTIL
ncbi:MAG: phosphoribosyltransferase [Actinomycetaceae bacterium]|nr:phosphoribosyltransferase [Actinomycetaceae bacterium]